MRAEARQYFLSRVQRIQGEVELLSSRDAKKQVADRKCGIALLAEVAVGTPWVEGCRRANAAAAIKVTRRGPESAPTAAEVDAFLADLG